MISSNLPEIKIKLKFIEQGQDLLEFLSNNKIVSSKSEARRIIANNGMKINNIKIDTNKKMLQLKDFEKNMLKISCGKKKHYVIKII